MHYDDRPLLGAGAFLNPMVYYKEREENISPLADFYETAFQECLDRMVKNRDERNEIMLGVDSYKQRRGRFGSEMANDTISLQQLSKCSLLFYLLSHI